MIPSGDSMTVGSILGALIGGIFKFILFLIALTISIAVCIGALVGIFLGAVALQSPERASEIWGDFKVKLAALFQGTVPQATCKTEQVSDTGISEEEYNKMKSELSALQANNQKLQGNVSELETKNVKLTQDMDELSKMVSELKESEEKINAAIAELSEQAKQEPDTALTEQVKKLEEMYTATNAAIEDLAGKLQALEESGSNDQQGGIFSYIESADDQTLFTMAIQEAVDKEMTYAQIDEFLTENLSPELDQIIKDHPSLTKDYIRSVRK
jgi:predicted  nucleic acid-binding Zn-ribbon protein